MSEQKGLVPKVEMQFPKMEKFLEKNSLKLKNELMRGVIVKNRHAIAINKNAVIIVDLTDIFLANEDNAIKYSLMEEVLDFMEEKAFPPEYWKELTSKNLLSLSDDKDAIVVYGPMYEKELDLEPINFSSVELSNFLRKFNSEEVNTNITCFNFNTLDLITKVFPAVKNDDIVISETANYFNYKFQVYNVFGFIMKLEPVSFSKEQIHINNF